MEKLILALTGPTASGKTTVAVEIAKATGGEIISADSRQVYRRMDIGTGKDMEEYGDVPAHLLDICEPGTKYNLHRYLKDFNSTLQEIRQRGNQPILCGGTGLYLESALSGISMPDVPCNPELRSRLADKSLPELAEILSGYKTLHNTTDIDTCKRAVRAIEIEEYYAANPSLAALSRRDSASPLPAAIYAIDIPRDLRRSRISGRLKSRLDHGMLDEIRALLAEGIPPQDLIYYGLEYKYLTLHVIGELTFDEMFSKLEMEIHRFAKRQMTWLRGMERRGFTLHWIPWSPSAKKMADKILTDFNS